MVAGELCHFTRHCVGLYFPVRSDQICIFNTFVIRRCAVPQPLMSTSGPLLLLRLFCWTVTVNIRDNIPVTGLSSLTHLAWDTHAIQPMHTLTRHTSYFSRREFTRIAPTNLGRYLTVLQVGIKWDSRTSGNQTSYFARTCTLFETLVWRKMCGGISKSSGILLKPHKCVCVCSFRVIGIPSVEDWPKDSPVPYSSAWGSERPQDTLLLPSLGPEENDLLAVSLEAPLLHPPPPAPLIWINISAVS